MDIFEFVEFTIKKIIRCLTDDSEYGFSGSEMENLKNSAKADIYILEKIKNKNININIKCIDNNIELKYKISKNKSQTVDPIPIVRDGIILKFKPVIIVPETFESKENQWIIVHEICHLLSIGGYIKNPAQKTYEHCFGINRYIYSENFELVNSRTDNRVNEIINDAVTWHFMEVINNCPVYPLNDYIKFHCQRIKEMKSFKSLVGYYFSNKSEDIYRLLKLY